MVRLESSLQDSQPDLLAIGSISLVSFFYSWYSFLGRFDHHILIPRREAISEARKGNGHEESEHCRSSFLHNSFVSLSREPYHRLIPVLIVNWLSCFQVPTPHSPICLPSVPLFIFYLFLFFLIFVFLFFLPVLRLYSWPQCFITMCNKWYALFSDRISVRHNGRVSCMLISSTSYEVGHLTACSLLSDTNTCITLG